MDFLAGNGPDDDDFDDADREDEDVDTGEADEDWDEDEDWEEDSDENEDEDWDDADGSDEDDSDDGPLVQSLQARGEIVYSHNWEGGAGEFALYVYKMDGRYYQYDMFEETVDGPFDSLVGALSDELLTVTGATTSVECKELDFNALAAMLMADVTAAERVPVNGRDWPPEA